MRSGHRHMSDSFINLEKLQTVRGELLAENGGNLKGKTSLIFPNAANQPQQFRTAQAARRGPAQGVRIDSLYDVVLVGLAKMLVDGFHVAESERLGQVQADILGLPALV